MNREQFVERNCEVLFELWYNVYAHRFPDTILLLGRVLLHDGNEHGNVESNYVSSFLHNKTF